MFKYFLMFLLSFCLCMSTKVLAETHEVGQKNKEFTIEKLTIKKGDTVSFINLDSFYHNVFSLSDAKLFDLGSYPKGEAREVVFDVAGEVEIECAIHPNMRMVIEVKE